MAKLVFPANFKWGTATAAYQIEGAPLEDGKGESIWDVFCRQKGAIEDGTSGDVACDHYHRYPEDIALMRDMNIKNYRLSVSWPRIIPAGRGSVNQKGLDFYDRLIDTMIKNGIEPYVTLYHWDLPNALEESGGWYNRDTAFYFSDYTDKFVRHFKDRVKNWITLNEPIVTYSMGYLEGLHAPGKMDRARSPLVVHNQMLAHGLALSAIRSIDGNLKVGLANALSPVYPYREEIDNAVAVNGMNNMRLFFDPVYKGTYPEEFQNALQICCPKFDSNDMKKISQPMDFLGINYYFRILAKANPAHPLNFEWGTPEYPGVEFTDMGWEVYPQGLYDLMFWLKKEYNDPEIMITENGAAFKDILESGKVNDVRRQAYLESHLAMLHKAIQNGARVSGYFQWSFLDNFEWQRGLSKRFGLVHVDFLSQKRTIKESGRWYASVCRDNCLRVD